MLKPHHRCLLAVLFFASLAGLLAAKVSGQSVDDVFITYRYAQNLVSGHGFVFNPGEWVLATSAPGWGLLLALGHLLTGLSLPALGTWTFAAALVAIAGLCFAEGQRLGREPEAWVAGTLLVSCSFLWPHNGFEYPASLLCILLATRLVERHGMLAGLLAAAAVWCRPDMLLVVACLMAMTLWPRRASPRDLWRSWPFVLSAGLGIALGLVLATLYYGHPLPVTLAAKRAQSLWLLPEASGWRFWSNGFGWVQRTYAGPWTPLLGLVGLAGLLRMLGSKSGVLRLLALSSVVISVSYPLLGIPFYTWYAMPLLIGLLYGYAWAAGEAWRRLWPTGNTMPSPAAPPQPTLWPRRALLRRQTLTIVLAIVLTGFPGYALRRAWHGFQLFNGFPRHQLYRDAGRWLATQTQPGDAFAFVEVGTLAFYSRMPARDLTGLVTPRVRPWSDVGDLSGAFLAHPAPWLVTSDRLEGLMGPVLDRSPIAPSLAHSLSNPDGTLRIYHLSPPTP